MSDKIFNKKQYKQRRQKLRNDATDAEKLLWQKLRANQMGVKFRRQQGIGDYIVDFYCPTLNLVIELDGSQHYQTQAIEYDTIRTQYLNTLGISVIRYNNYHIISNLPIVIADICTQIEQVKLKLLIDNKENETQF